MSFILIGWSMRTLFALLVMPLVCPNIRSSPQSHIYIDTERPKHISDRKLAKKEQIMEVEALCCAQQLPVGAS